MLTPSRYPECSELSGSGAVTLLEADTGLVQVEHSTTKQRHKIWFEAPRIAQPKSDLATGFDDRLYPTECRESVCGLCMHENVSHCCTTSWVH